MTLAKYLSSTGISVADFAHKVGAKSRATIYRYITDDGTNRRRPNSKMMIAIMKATGGLVGPADFFDLPKIKTKRKHSASVEANA